MKIEINDNTTVVLVFLIIAASTVLISLVDKPDTATEKPNIPTVVTNNALHDTLSQ